MKELNLTQMEELQGGEIRSECGLAVVGIVFLWFNPELLPVYGGYTANAANECFKGLIK